jgi:hypothetical protein
MNWVTRALTIAFSKYPDDVKLVFIIAVGGKEWEIITANPKWRGKFASRRKCQIGEMPFFVLVGVLQKMIECIFYFWGMSLNSEWIMWKC